MTVPAVHLALNRGLIFEKSKSPLSPRDMRWKWGVATKILVHYCQELAVHQTTFDNFSATLYLLFKRMT